jgi:hypothetical protein
MQTSLGGVDKRLVAEDVWTMLGDRERSPFPYLIETPGRDKLYTKLRVVSARIDPCFDAANLAHGGPCVRQVRLVAQPMEVYGTTPASETYSFFDASVHLFYKLDEDAFARLIVTLDELRRANTGNPMLGVHPVLAREGLGGPFATRLRALILSSCDVSNLTRMTFMATGRSGKNWFWGILDRQPDGSFAASKVPLRPDTVMDGFTQNGIGAAHDGVPLGLSIFPDQLIKTEDAVALSDSEFRAAADKIRRIENPNLMATKDVNCASCHLAGAALGNALAARGLRSIAAPSTYLAPRGQRTDLPRDPVYWNGRNMHAFSYMGSLALVSQRTANESARIADYLSTSSLVENSRRRVR